MTKMSLRRPCHLFRKLQAIGDYSWLFCEKGSEEGELHQVSTFDADSNIYADHDNRTTGYLHAWVLSPEEIYCKSSKVPPLMPNYSEKSLQRSCICQEIDSRWRKHTQG